MRGTAAQERRGPADLGDLLVVAHGVAGTVGVGCHGHLRGPVLAGGDADLCEGREGLGGVGPVGQKGYDTGLGDRVQAVHAKTAAATDRT